MGPTGVACEARAGLHLHLLRAREVAGRDDSMARHFLARDLVDLGVDLIGLIGPADKVEWVSVKSAAFACVDGRSANGELHAHGGDFGEFLLALTVYEQMLQKQLSQSETTYLFGKWLGEGASFAMCTDAAAVTQLASAVSYKYPLDLARPPEEHAASLMLRVIAPEFQGDGHTKWLLQHPETYAVRRVLAEQLIFLEWLHR